MWPYLIIFILLGCLAALHLFWKGRLSQLGKKLSVQQEEHGQIVAEKQAQQEALFNSMAEGVLVLDRSERIELINQSLQRLLAPTVDVKGQTVLEAFGL